MGAGRNYDRPTIEEQNKRASETDEPQTASATAAETAEVSGSGEVCIVEVPLSRRSNLLTPHCFLFQEYYWKALFSLEVAPEPF